MRNHNSYLATLLPNFERKRIIEDLVFQSDDYESNIMPTLVSANGAFGKDELKSKVNEKLVKDIKPFLPKGKTMFMAIEESTKNIPELGKVCNKLINEYFDTNVTSVGMTFTRINVLKIIEVLNFVNQYTRRLLLLTMAAEYGDEEIDDKAFSKEIRFVTKNAKAYGSCLKVLANSPKTLESKIKNIPEVLAYNPTSTPEEVAKTIGESKVDPVGLNLIPYRYNPIFHIRMGIEVWLDGRRRMKKEEISAIKLRILALKMKSENANKADLSKLKKQIQYHEDRVFKLRKDLNEDIQDALPSRKAEVADKLSIGMESLDFYIGDAFDAY